MTASEPAVGVQLPVPRRRGVPSDSEERLIVARALGSWRRRRFMTISQLAAKSGVSGRHLRQLEDGASMPTVSTVMKLATALSIPPGRLFREDGRLAEARRRSPQSP